MAAFKARGARGQRRQRRVQEGALGVRGVTARVALVLLMLAACVVPVVFLATPVSYVPLVACVATVALSFAYLRVLAGSIEYSEGSLLESCERGTEAAFAVTFKNRSALPVLRLEPYFYVSNLFGEVDDSIPASMVLMPREECEFRFGARFEHLGTYSAGVSTIVVSDLLGLFRHTIVNPNRHEVKVLPKVFDVSGMSLDNVSAQESRKAFQPIVTDDMDYAGVRDYEPGDPLKTIHWKLSSRNPLENYYTRLFETFGNPGIDIIIDHTAPRYDSESLMQVFDGLIESALSVALFAASRGVDATFTYTDKYGEARRVQNVSVETSSRLIDDIPRVAVGEGDEALELLRRCVHSIHGEGNVAFCTAHVGEELVQLLQDAKARKRNAMLFVVVPKLLEPAERDELLRPLRRLCSAQVPCFVISDATQLETAGA
ncbi:MAG: DUF58 domain-containing protein [Coriobacteriales bacterium]